MELKQIKELMTAMERAGIKKLAIKEKTGFELQLERHDEPSYHAPVAAYSEVPTRFMPHHHLPQRTPVQEEGPPKEEKIEGKYVVSPMVGTLYLAPSPEDPSFVKVGERIDENTVVCIVEAMKVMNEVKAGVSGVVAEICLDNAHPVEFGSKIFRIV